jgi:hypothetical protein
MYLPLWPFRDDQILSKEGEDLLKRSRLGTGGEGGWGNGGREGTDMPDQHSVFAVATPSSDVIGVESQELTVYIPTGLDQTFRLIESCLTTPGSAVCRSCRWPPNRANVLMIGMPSSSYSANYKDGNDRVQLERIEDL